MRYAGLTVKPRKYQIAVIRSFPPPQIKREKVQPFLGLAGYHWKFIPDSSSIAAPLTDLTRGGGVLVQVVPDIEGSGPGVLVLVVPGIEGSRWGVLVLVAPGIEINFVQTFSSILQDIKG